MNDSVNGNLNKMITECEDHFDKQQQQQQPVQGFQNTRTFTHTFHTHTHPGVLRYIHCIFRHGIHWKICTCSNFKNNSQYGKIHIHFKPSSKACVFSWQSKHIKMYPHYNHTKFRCTEDMETDGWAGIPFSLITMIIETSNDTEVFWYRQKCGGEVPSLGPFSDHQISK